MRKAPTRKIQKSVSRFARAKNALEPILTPGRDALHELLMFTGAMSGWHPMSIGEYEDRLHQQEIRERRDWLKYLEERKWIERKKIGKKLLVRLTAKGWQQAMRDRIRCTRTKCESGICLVVFDVPETERHVRDVLRDILQGCRFTMLQKSVWVTNKDVAEPLCALLQGAKLDQWVRIIVGNELRQPFLKRAALRAGAALKSKRAVR